MTSRLVVLDLVANLRIWVGLVAVTAVNAAVLTLTGSFIDSGIRAGGTTALATYALSGVIVALTAATAVVVVSSIAGLVVRLQRREHALWQIVGVLPAQITRIVLTQILVAALLGSALGTAAAVPLVRPLVGDLVHGVATGLDELRPVVSATASATAIALTVVLAGLAGLRPARVAGRSSPLALLEVEDGATTKSATRLVLAGVLTLSALGLAAALHATPLDRVGIPLLLAGVLLASAFAAAGSRVFPALLSVWTRVVPPDVMPSWTLARATSRDDIGRGAASIGPLVLGITTPGLLFGTRAALLPPSTTSSLQPEAVVLLIGGPVLLAVVGSTVYVFMAGRTRAREQALLRAAGAPAATILGTAAAEATIVGGTALVASIMIVVADLGYAAALAGSATAALRGFEAAWPALLVAVGCWCLLLLATCLPAALALRDPPVRQLAQNSP